MIATLTILLNHIRLRRRRRACRCRRSCCRCPGLRSFCEFPAFLFPFTVCVIRIPSPGEIRLSRQRIAKREYHYRRNLARGIGRQNYQGDREGRPYNTPGMMPKPYIVGATLAVALSPISTVREYSCYNIIHHRQDCTTRHVPILIMQKICHLYYKVTTTRSKYADSRIYSLSHHSPGRHRPCRRRRPLHYSCT